MATLPQLTDGTKVDAAKWNAHVDQINTIETRTTDSNTGNTALGNRVGTLETNQGTRGTHGTVYSEIGTLKSQARGGAYYGTWSDAGGNVGGQVIDGDTGGGDKGVKITDINTEVEAPSGCSFSSGTFTATQAGKWLFSATTQYVGGDTDQRALYLAKGNAANSPTGTKYGLNGGPSLDSQATTCRITLAANEQVSIYVACWTSTGSVQIWKAAGCTFTATWIGP